MQSLTAERERASKRVAELEALVQQYQTEQENLEKKLRDQISATEAAKRQTEAVEQQLKGTVLLFNNYFSFRFFSNRTLTLMQLLKRRSRRCRRTWVFDRSCSRRRKQTTSENSLHMQRTWKLSMHTREKRINYEHHWRR